VASTAGAKSSILGAGALVTQHFAGILSFAPAGRKKPLAGCPRHEGMHEKFEGIFVGVCAERYSRSG
jgi:hypothetical protein